MFEGSAVSPNISVQKLSGNQYFRNNSTFEDYLEEEIFTGVEVSYT